MQRASAPAWNRRQGYRQAGIACSRRTDRAISAGQGAHFDATVIKFHERYNSRNPTLPIGECSALENPRELAHLTCGDSKINETLYTSTALEKDSYTIKTLPLTYLPLQGGTEKAARETDIDYMAALLREFEPKISVEQSTV